MRALVLSVAMVSMADAKPFRWQAADGTRVEAEISNTVARAQLAVTEPEPHVVLLAGAREHEPLAVRGHVDDLVILGSDHGWRLRWKNGRFVVRDTWKRETKAPSWATPNKLTTYQGAFEEARQLLRFEGTLPGLERFLGDNTIVVTTNNKQPTTTTGRELLERWEREGFPLVRGVRKGAGLRCASLPVNWSLRTYVHEHTPAKDPKGDRFAAACMGKDLRFERIDLTVPP